MNIICMGDSITYGYGLPDLSCRWSDIVAARTGYNLINRGINGDTTNGMLARCQTQAFNQNADAMILLGGINDISIHKNDYMVRTNVITIFRQAMACGLPLLLCVPLPVAHEDLGRPAWEPNRDNKQIADLCEQYADWIRQFAYSNQIPLIDFRSAFILPDGKTDRTLFQDGLHPTTVGHQKMADVVCQILESLYTH